jgi:hypothetical protein
MTGFMNKKNLNILIFVIFVFGLLIYAWYDVRRSEKLIDEILLEYPRIDTSAGVSGRVNVIYCPPKVRCGGGLVTLVVLDNSQKVSIYAHRDLKDSLRVDQILTVGSRIVVNPGSDTLLIFNESIEQAPVRFLLDNDTLVENLQ